jgi:hypothetical protein
MAILHVRPSRCLGIPTVTDRGVQLDPNQDNVRLYHLCSADVNRIQELGVGREVQLMREFAIV